MGLMCTLGLHNWDGSMCSKCGKMRSVGQQDLKAENNLSKVSYLLGEKDLNGLDEAKKCINELGLIGDTEALIEVLKAKECSARTIETRSGRRYERLSWQPRLDIRY